jgi:hypothetical protein
MLQTSNGFSCRALAFDLLGIVCIATIWSIDMSISGVTGTSALRQQLATASTQPKSSTTAQASSTTTSSTGGTGSPFFSVDDGISVGLPNGMSVGVFHLAQSAGSAGQSGGTSDGSSSDASYSQMIASIEQLVAAFENSPASASSTAAQTSSTDGTSAGGNGASATSGSGSNASMDGISVDLPNGLSVEVFHAEQGNETSADSAASFAQMANTMEQLVAALDKYPSAAAGAYANAGANTSSASTATGSLNAVA